MDPTDENVSLLDVPNGSRRHSSGDELDDEDDGNDYDMAITHARNAQLRRSPMVEDFFKKLREHTSLADPRTRTWLGDLPFHMHQDAIPLFVATGASLDDFEDYQLHPCYTFLELNKSAELPHNYLLRLSMDGIELDVPKLVIGIGRLFVNASDGEEGRISKWTGYEVFVDQHLALWMVFDRQSIYHPAADWYPLFCKLSLLKPQTSNHGQSSARSPCFHIARFLPSLRDLADAKFETVIKETETTNRSGEMKVDQIEHNEVATLLEAELPPQQAESTTTVKPVTMATDNVDLYRLEERLSEAVRDGGYHAQKINDLLRSVGEDLDTIKKLITKQVVADAARNEACGLLIMNVLIRLSESRMKENISVEVVKTAAGNHQDGAGIMAELLKHFQKAVCDNLSGAALCHVAENKRSGMEIMRMLRDANANAVDKAFSDVKRRAEKGNEWCVQALPDLKRMMRKTSEISHMATGGGQLGKAAPITERPHRAKVENA